MKEKLNEHLLGPDLRPQSSGPSREVQTAFNPFETTAAAFTHIVSKLARRLSGATLYTYKCVKRPGSGFFFFLFFSQRKNSWGCRYSKLSSICWLALFPPALTKLQIINPLSRATCLHLTKRKGSIGRHCTDVKITTVTVYPPLNWHCKRPPVSEATKKKRSKKEVLNYARKEM